MASTGTAEEENFRVVLLGIGKDTAEEKEAFCRRIASRYGVARSLLEKIAESPPIVLKKNLSRRRSEMLAHLITSAGGRVSIEKREETIPVGLEFETGDSAPLALESCAVRKSAGGSWSVVGRVRNISSEGLEETWALVQLFGEAEELLTFEEVPLSFDPLPPGESAPFRAVFDGRLVLKRVTVAFKNASGRPIAARDRLRRREWIPVKTVLPQGDEEPKDSDLDVPVLELYVRPGEKSRAKEEEPLVPDGGKLLGGMASVIKPETEVFPSQCEPSEEGRLKDEPSERDRGTASGEETTGSLVEEKEVQAQGALEVSQDEPDEKEPERETEGERVASLRDGDFPAKDRDEGGLSDGSGEEAARDEGLGLLSEALDSFHEAREERREEGPDREEASLFPWIDAFREAVCSYYGEDRDGFSTWFRKQEGENRFQGPFHRVVTILTHARFSQRCASEEALENTARVYDVMLKKGLQLEEIPFLKGTRFASAETWRNLFFRAIPKLREISEHLLSKENWEALELEKLIQIIPQMSLEASRLAVGWLSSLTSDKIRVDFRKTTPEVGKALYRVASRLGIVDPRFDHYRGPQSLGDLKIEAFARIAFPEHPRKIEAPMNWVGKEGEPSGPCLPIHPICAGCLFEAFCPKLRLDFDPAEKGLFPTT